MSEAPLRGPIPLEEATRHFDPILRPDLAERYATRAARLRQLAEGHELADYLRLAADIVDGQALCLGEVATDFPLDTARIAAEGRWPMLLESLSAHLRPRAPQPVIVHLDALAAMPLTVRRQAGAQLLAGEFAAVDAAIAPLLWAALSSEVAQLARRVPLPQMRDGETAHCPMCGCAPVASCIHTGERQGLRYLHCALCECEWHMVRAKCTNCGDAGDLDYLSFDTAEAALRAEACGACTSYLKVISQEREPAAETVADDLATLVLDDAAQAEGFRRSGFNPFALPGA